MIKRVLPPIVPAASRMLYHPSRFDQRASGPVSAITLHWEAAGQYARMIATMAAPADQTVDLGCYPERVRAQGRAMLRSHCQPPLRAASEEVRPWVYGAGEVPLRPVGNPAGLLCLLQADGWVHLIAEDWPGRGAAGQPLGRYPVWAVLQWLGSPPAPPPIDEDTPLSLPAPMEPEIRALLAWWRVHVQTPGDRLTGGVSLSTAQQTAFAHALAAEVHAHLAYIGWDAALPAWREGERALGLQDDPDPLLIRAAAAAGLWTTLLPGWSNQRPALRIWINPGQVRVAIGPTAPQIIWPRSPAQEVLNHDLCG